jgi:type III restriction enzyme
MTCVKKKPAKIACGEAHFKALARGENNPARFVKATKLEDVLGGAIGYP